MSKTKLMMIFLIGLALATQGCSRLIGEGMEATMGAKGSYFEEKPLAADKEQKVLAEYQRFELGQVKNSTGKFLPPEFMTYLPKQFEKQLADSRLPKGVSGKTIVFNVEVIHYEAAGLTDNVFGPFEEVVARVQLLDKQTGAVKAQGVAIGRTEQSVSLGPEKKAEGLAKGLIKWAKDYYPKPEKAEKK